MRTDGHDEANSRCSSILRTRLKNPYFVSPEVSLPYSHWPVMGFCSANTEASQRPHPPYILASPYLRHCSGRFTSYFPNKKLYKLLPCTRLDQILNHTNLDHTVISCFSQDPFQYYLPIYACVFQSPFPRFMIKMFQSQTFYMCATCSVHLIFLDMFTPVIPAEEAKL